ncbi:MAG: prephenate dehydrogenase/arogenate dehydrogenase family protein [Deltaproteobacteria bacterium]|nr:prephenate dehydrogenase/arogenate dehydrogenase family protein [Deltaproteobacteria bacterium]
MALFGLGRFGTLAAGVLKDYFDIVAYDPAPLERHASRVGVPLVSLDEAAVRPILVLAPPMSEMRSLLVSIAPYVKPGTLVCDTCSVKMVPASLMESLLPDDVQVLGTHPCFGPDSIQPGFTGNKIVLCPIRVRNLSSIVRFLEGLGLTVVVASAEEHDKLMARTQALSQFLGKAVLQMGLKQERISTTGFDQLLEILQYVRNDTDRLFHDLQTMNPYAAEMRRKLVNTLAEIDRMLDIETHGENETVASSISR